MASQKIRPIWEDDPPSTMTPTSALIIALLTLGAKIPVAQSPEATPFPWHEQVHFLRKGVTVRRFLWRLQDGKLADGTEMRVVIKRWNDPVWLAANPLHEITVLRNGLLNAVQVAKAVRETVPRVRVAQAKSRREVVSVYIPLTAGPAERAHYAGMLDGTVTPGTKFVPKTADAVE